MKEKLYVAPSSVLRSYSSWILSPNYSIVLQLESFPRIIYAVRGKVAGDLAEIIGDLCDMENSPWESFFFFLIGLMMDVYIR